MEIREDDLTGDEIAAFLAEHLRDMRGSTPPGTAHALDLDQLRSDRITFWSVWNRDRLAGCGALKELDSTTGEVKSMRTAPAFRRQGVASLLMDHLLAVARQRGYEELLLETGSGPHYLGARMLYERYGFSYRGPFGDYPETPHNVFMVLVL